MAQGRYDSLLLFYVDDAAALSPQAKHLTNAVPDNQKRCKALFVDNKRTIVYNSRMRRRDENKKEAIFQATKELLNEVGFSEISMSKIAKRAGVSAATIYVYFDNKDDMLKKLYLDVKNHLAAAIIHTLDETQPIRHIVELAMRGYLDFILAHREDYLFLEQFANSPMLENLCIEEHVPSFEAMHTIIAKGQREGILRQVDETLLISFCYLPIAQLVKENVKGTLELTEEAIQTVLDMSWNAIRA